MFEQIFIIIICLIVFVLSVDTTRKINKMQRKWNKMHDDYPKEKCKKHPSRMWEWDGYGWICAGCIFNDPDETKSK